MARFIITHAKLVNTMKILWDEFTKKRDYEIRLNRAVYLMKRFLWKT